MPATTFPEYSRAVESLLDAAVASTEAVLARIETDARSSFRGRISGVLRFDDGSELHFREFVDTSLTEPRLAYAYHYQDAETTRFPLRQCKASSLVSASLAQAYAGWHAGLPSANPDPRDRRGSRWTPSMTCQRHDDACLAMESPLSW